jgi:hypothetical protein
VTVAASRMSRSSAATAVSMRVTSRGGGGVSGVDPSGSDAGDPWSATGGDA